jgi:cerevisin
MSYHPVTNPKFKCLAALVNNHPKPRASMFRYNDLAGEGVTVYVVDTGINVDHDEFEGRASWGTTIPQDENDKDENGHGTVSTLSA